MNSSNRSTHIRLTSHPEPNTATTRMPIKWGAKDPKERGPVIGSVTNPADRNVIGAHGGGYFPFCAPAVARGGLKPPAPPPPPHTPPPAGNRTPPNLVQAGQNISPGPPGP